MRDDVQARVQELIRNITAACLRLPGEDHNQANKRAAEEFLARIGREFPGRCIARRQPLSALSVRTTDANYRRETLGADFVRAFIPFEGYQRLDDLLEEAAHLHGIKYNSFLSGGTTDHVSWLEVNNGLLDRLSERLGAAPKRRIPAGALIAMCPGKASPFVFGGKIHTPNDTPDRVYPEPLAETLQIVDYFFHVMQGGIRPAEPRTPGDCHYARLYKSEGWKFLALKDAIEPNRRNVNMIYRVEGDVATDGPDVAARVRVLETIGWGVQTSLDEQLDSAIGEGKWDPIHVTEIHVENGPAFLRRVGLIRGLRAAWFRALGSLEQFMGRYSFAVFFLAAYLVAQSFNVAMDWAFHAWLGLAIGFFRFAWVTIPATVVLEFALIGYLFAVRIPAAMDNSYKRLNRADNLLSLKRQRPTKSRAAENSGETSSEGKQFHAHPV